MKAILFSEKKQPGETAPDHLPGLAHLCLTDVPVPDLPNENWVVIKSKIAGICGSDLGFLQGKPMPAAEPESAVPLELDAGEAPTPEPDAGAPTVVASAPEEHWFKGKAKS